MKVFEFKSGSRPITCVRFNPDGDLLFTATKEYMFSAWRTDNGDCLGTYHGHGGAILSLDTTSDTNFVISASSDNTVQIWKTETGKSLVCLTHQAPMSIVEFNSLDTMFFAVQDNAMRQPCLIFVYSWSFDEETSDFTTAVEQKHVIGPFSDYGVDRITCASWGPEDKFIIAGDSTGKLLIIDMSTQQVTACLPSAHKGRIGDICFSQDRTHFVTASDDTYMKVWDCTVMPPVAVRSLTSGVPLNSASLSPIRFHACAGGGISAEAVAQTSTDEDKFTARFFDLVYGDLLGHVKGHIGPINSIRFSPDGRSFATGSEDSSVRLCFFDPKYFEDISRERTDMEMEEEFSESEKEEEDEIKNL
ncbi:hypothetical protein RCL1_006255 [Eukaryota sp. TZLM3-RCL]